MRKIDKESREMLRYLNLHNKLSSVTLAEVFCQNYKIELDNALETLSFLENNELVRVKTNDDGSILMIQVTHLGRTYEEELQIEEKEIKNKKMADRMWNIITLLLSSILTILINLIMKWGFGI